MDKSQYQPPRSIHSEALYAQEEQRSIPASPERITHTFDFIKKIEALIHSFRETAEAIEQKEGRFIELPSLHIRVWMPGRPHEKIIREQLDAERARSMDLFDIKNQYGVYYGAQVDSPLSDSAIGHWYIEEAVKGKFGTGQVTHIETHPDHVKKFNHDGQRVPLTISDLQTFLNLAYHYVYAIMELYPFDRDRAEVLLDELDVPDDISLLLPPEHQRTTVSFYDQQRAA